MGRVSARSEQPLQAVECAAKCGCARSRGGRARRRPAPLWCGRGRGASRRVTWACSSARREDALGVRARTTAAWPRDVGAGGRCGRLIGRLGGRRDVRRLRGRGRDVGRLLGRRLVGRRLLGLPPSLSRSLSRSGSFSELCRRWKVTRADRPTTRPPRRAPPPRGGGCHGRGQ